MAQHRRDFIRTFSLLSLSLGLNPLEALSSNLDRKSADYTVLYEEVRRSVEEFNYVTKILNTDPELLQKEYNKIYTIAAKISESKFKNYDKERQIRAVSRIERRIDRTKVTKENVRTALIDNSTTDWTNALNAASFGYSLTSTVFSGVACLASLMAVPYGAGIPAVSTTCPIFLLNAGFTTFAGTQLVGNKTRAYKALQYSSNNLVTCVKNNPLNKFLNDGNYSFKIGEINLSQDSNSFQLPVSGSTNTENDFHSFLKEKLSDGNLIISEAKLRAFLDEYIERVGQVQAELLAEYIEKSNQARTDQQKEFKEKVAFYQSIGKLTSLMFGSIFPQKEAEILSILANVGFEYMATGIALGPYGWGAVGIQIATVLLSSKNGSGEFQEYVLKALNHINQQLNTINRKLDDVYYNQIEILVELHRISSKIDSLSYNVLNGLESISEELNDLTVAIDQLQRNNYYKLLKENNLNLKDKLIDDSSTMTSEDVFKGIRALRNGFTIHLNESYFTSYVDANIDGNLLKKEIYKSFNYLTQVSLYDKVGLIPAAYEYTPERAIVRSKKDVYHPIESYLACQNLTSWLTLSELKKTLSLQLIKEIENNIRKSISALNQYGDLDVVLTKTDAYRSYHHSIITNLYKTLGDLESKSFRNSNKTWLKALRLTPSGYSFAQNPSNGSTINFNDNKFDVAFFDVLIDFGLIKGIKEISALAPNMSKRSVSKNQSLIGQEIGNKIIEIEFGDLILNHQSNKGTLRSLKIRYKKTATCTTEKAEADYVLLGCVDVFCDYDWYYYSTPTAYSLKTDFLNKWKAIVKAAYRRQENRDVNSEIGDFDSMSFVDFSKTLIQQSVNKKKKEFLTNAYNAHYQENAKINGIGTSLLVLSLLNKTINSDFIYPFVIDYLDETYIDNDFKRLFDKNYLLGATQKQRKLKTELEELSINFNLNLDNDAIKLNVNDWKGYICLLIKHRVELTVNKSLNGCEEIKPNDSEPYLADSLNKLDWFRNNYLNLSN